MKKMITICSFVFCGFVAFAQDSSYSFKEERFFKIPEIMVNKIPSYLKKYDVTTLKNSFQNYSTSSVIILPQDNMPCFVPDVSQVIRIPNQLGIGFAIPIPNAIKFESK